MCGLFGIVSKENVVPLLLEGLKTLEYRGYDSAGVAVIQEGALVASKSVGDVDSLQRKTTTQCLSGTSGIAHTRWATHGPPSLQNAHPHLTKQIALVHNGIIENHEDLRKKLTRRLPAGETDTEVLALLLDESLGTSETPQLALQQALSLVEGSYAVAAIFPEQPDQILVARRGSPVCVAVGPQGSAVSSDPRSLPFGMKSYVPLEDGDLCLIRQDGFEIYGAEGDLVERAVHTLETESLSLNKGSHRHFMHKEIWEQTHTIPDSIASADEASEAVALLSEAKSLTLIACGTSYHAGLIAAHWFEEFSGIATQVELASEFRYRKKGLREKHAVLAISQSGETADTLAALEESKAQQLKTLAIVNVPDSSMSRVADAIVRTEAGAEIGVASTKAFTAQLAVLFSLSLQVGARRQLIPEARLKALQRRLRLIHQDVAVVLGMEAQLRSIALRIAASENLFLIGRGPMVAMALEGALKVKETSYIHAEGFAGGELKHGSIALIEPGTPVLALCPHGDAAQKTRANAAEVACRGASVLYLESAIGEPEQNPSALRLPHVPECLAPMVFAPALQLISYHLAVARMTNVDRPRNLAKSVTVE